MTITQGSRPLISLMVFIGALLLASSSAFVAKIQTKSFFYLAESPAAATHQHQTRRCSRSMLLFAANEETEEDPRPREMTPTERILENEKLDPATRAVVEAAQRKADAAAKSADTKKSYPIDLPSPLLLATSMLLAIASTGTSLGDIVSSWAVYYVDARMCL